MDFSKDGEGNPDVETLGGAVGVFDSSEVHPDTRWDWYIYSHLVNFYGECRQIYHTLSVWDGSMR